MKTKTIIALVLGLLVGLLTNHLWQIKTGSARHWRAILVHNAYMRDPANYKQVPGARFTMATPPLDPEPHLAALVTAGELHHLDLVLPTVAYSNRTATRYWVSFCEAHTNEIVYAYGNPSSVAFPVKGMQPIHLNIWYIESGEKVVQELIRELEAMGTEQEPTPGRTVTSPAAGSAP